MTALCLFSCLAANLSSCTIPPSWNLFQPSSWFGESEDRISLKGVHLDGIGLLNQEVLVSGRVQMIGPFETYMVIEEERVRMLVDLSGLGGLVSAQKLTQGQIVEVAGKVQSGENGHVYLVASAIRAG